MAAFAELQVVHPDDRSSSGISRRAMVRAVILLSPLPRRRWLYPGKGRFYFLQVLLGHFALAPGGEDDDDPGDDGQDIGDLADFTYLRCERRRVSGRTLPWLRSQPGRADREWLLLRLIVVTRRDLGSASKRR